MPSEKAASQTHLTVSDGAGGPITARRRVEQTETPITVVVPPEEADSWMAHLEAEAHERGWSGGGIAQLQDVGNSGSMSFHAAATPLPFTVHVIWQRARGMELAVRTEPEPAGEQELAAAYEFVDAVRSRHAERRLHRRYTRTILTYSGLPWKGEVWLTDSIRLGPPTQYPAALLGPQCILVDTLSHGIGLRGSVATSQQQVDEIAIFLRIVLGISCVLSRLEYGWRSDADPETGSMKSHIGVIGYHEEAETVEMPLRGVAPPAARRDVVRPGLGPYGISPDMSEQWVPSDIEDLWSQFTALSPVSREQFLRAGKVLQAADALWPEHRTGYVALNVVACEALKPPGRRYDAWNAYDVIESLLGAAESNRLRRYVTHPQKIRSKHLHRGELSGGELMTAISNDWFKDPTFDTMMRDLERVSRACVIEWLRGVGNFSARARQEN